LSSFANHESDVFVHTYLSANVIISSNADEPAGETEKNARGRHGGLSASKLNFYERCTWLHLPVSRHRS